MSSYQERLQRALDAFRRYPNNDELYQDLADLIVNAPRDSEIVISVEKAGATAASPLAARVENLGLVFDEGGGFVDDDGVMGVIVDEMDVLAKGGWRDLPRETQRTLLSFVVAVLRYLQDERRIIHPALNGSFSAATKYSQNNRPGHVEGLSRFHGPLSGSWERDAKGWWRRLLEIRPGE